jgi:hypothetical protein
VLAPLSVKVSVWAGEMKLRHGFALNSPVAKATRLNSLGSIKNTLSILKKIRSWLRLLSSAAGLLPL